MRFIYLLMFFLTIVKIDSTAQTDSLNTKIKFEIDATINFDHGDTLGLKVQLILDSTVIETVSDKSSPIFFLAYNQIYLLRISKEGYITKTIEILTTNIKIQIWNDGFFPYKMKLRIFKQQKDKIIEFTQSISTIFYDKRFDDFGYKTNYNIIEKDN